jgi:hypothetical protein
MKEPSKKLLAVRPGGEFVGEWKAQISVRVRQELRRELEEFAYGDRRKLGNVAETLLEWAWEQLRAAGSIERLLKFNIKPRGTTNGSAENRHERQDQDRRPGQSASPRKSGAPNFKQSL